MVSKVNIKKLSLSTTLRFFAVPLVLVILFSFYLFANGAYKNTETMAARELVQNAVVLTDKVSDPKNDLNPFPLSGARGEPFLNTASQKPEEEAASSVLLGCGTCGNAAKWQT